MTIKEVWRDIPNYEKLYQVSNYGRIRSYDKYVNNRFKDVLRKGRIIKLNINPSGYYTVNLYKNKKKQIKTVHRLVAEVFIPKISYKNIINHIDGNKLNNNTNNLEWCTYSENTKKFIELKKPNFKNYNFKRKKVIAIKDDEIITFNSISECAEKLKSDKGTIFHILNGKGKTTKGYKIIEGGDDLF